MKKNLFAVSYLILTALDIQRLRLTATLDRTLSEQGMPQTDIAYIVSWIGKYINVLVEDARLWIYPMQS